MFLKNNELNSRFIRKFVKYVIKDNETLAFCRSGEKMIAQYKEFQAFEGSFKFSYI